MMFQASNTKERLFLELLDDNLQPIRLLYSKEELWLKYFGHSKLLYARALRAIVNHAPTGEYCLRLFLQEEFDCLCDQYSIKSQRYILCYKTKVWTDFR